MFTFNRPFMNFPRYRKTYFRHRCNMAKGAPACVIDFLLCSRPKFIPSDFVSLTYFLRWYGPASRTLAMTLAAFFAMTSKFPAAIAAWSKRGATRPTEAAPFFRYSPALSKSTPLVGLIARKGKAELTAFTQLGPPATPGNNFWSGAP